MITTSMPATNNELDGMRRAECEQKLVDLFWGIDKEKEDSILCTIGMAKEDKLSRKYSKMIEADKLRIQYANLQKEREEKDASNRAEKEEMNRRSYMRAFNDATSSDIIMNYEWDPTQFPSSPNGGNTLRSEWLIDLTSMTSRLNQGTGNFHTNHSRGRQMRMKMASANLSSDTASYAVDPTLSQTSRRVSISSASSRGSGPLSPITRKPKNGRRKKNKHPRRNPNPVLPEPNPVLDELPSCDDTAATPRNLPTLQENCADVEILWETIFASAATCEEGDQFDTASGAELLEAVQREYKFGEKDALQASPCLQALVTNSKLQDTLSSLQSCTSLPVTAKLRLVEWIEFCNATQDLITWNNGVLSDD